MADTATYKGLCFLPRSRRNPLANSRRLPVALAAASDESLSPRPRSTVSWRRAREIDVGDYSKPIFLLGLRRRIIIGWSRRSSRASSRQNQRHQEQRSEGERCNDKPDIAHRIECQTMPETAAPTSDTGKPDLRTAVNLSKAPPQAAGVQLTTLEALMALVTLTEAPGARSDFSVLVWVVFFVGPTMVRWNRVPAGMIDLPLLRAWMCT